jgi:hypothetical protein
VTLQGACEGNTSCYFPQFIELAKNVSFYGNSSGYNTLCGRKSSPFDPPKPKATKVNQFIRSNKIEDPHLIGIWTQVLLSYLALMIIAGLYYLAEHMKNTKSEEQIKLMNPKNGPVSEDADK